ncbi:hypothetical protein Sgly_3023 [Syntrophobotulus glycolicus DSM 8271]|uniref:Uncharacterized protein n=1 Tax=Syntrophobotulus glycolicus (strain DSM 8271 / FlGlyR) TaxID=645991 RepID=F0T0C0_SYNGF|nr:hypothetical protein [Syntrophobotulus glycolicus]ADY57292.1 hypothetical protein Sgly_3023 [Syntrophobotulus glycolicus DSM 8271]
MRKISSDTMHYVDDLRREINKLYAAPLSTLLDEETFHREPCAENHHPETKLEK